MMLKDLHKISVLSTCDTLNSPKETRTMTGFTIIELIVTLSVLSLIMALAIPSFRNMLMNSRLSSSTDLLVNALNYARLSQLCALNSGLKPTENQFQLIYTYSVIT